jgi:hypothetical protein
MIPKELLTLIEDFERDFMIFLWKEVKMKEFSEPVVYAGSGGDIEHALFLGRNLVFFDNHLPEENFNDILGKIDRIGVLEEEERKEGRFSAIFKIGREEYSLIFYGLDATKIFDAEIPELRKGISVFFVKDPYPRAESAGSIREPNFFSRALSAIVKGGYYLEKECPITCGIPPESIGFRLIKSGRMASLSFRSSPANLYLKFKEVDMNKTLIEDFEDCLNRKDVVRDLVIDWKSM